MKSKHMLIQICRLGAAVLQAVSCGAQPVTQIAAGSLHTLFLKSDGSLRAMGDNQYGQIGDGTYYSPNRPELIVSNRVTAIAAGDSHSLFLKSDGSLWVMGSNAYGQLGDGSYNVDTNRPEQIISNGVVAIAAGYAHSLFLKSDGSLWAMGNNQYGQLGDATTAQTNQPDKIVASGVTTIAAGRYHSLFLKNDGSLWAMGFNGSGQLGDQSFNDAYQPKQIVASNVMAIAAGCGSFHSLFLKRDGSLWGMGNNYYGQLGDGSSGSINSNTNQPEQIVASNVTAIAAGAGHSLFLKRDGSLWVMGDNNRGQLGDGTFNQTNQPEQIVASNATAVAAGGIAYSIARWSHTLFIKSNGSLWAMGGNQIGQLGDGNFNTATNRPEQIVAGVPPGYNQIFSQLLPGGKMRLSFVGIAEAQYALDRAFGLSPTSWVPQATNPADSAGELVFTNTPSQASNNFWRIRSVP